MFISQIKKNFNVDFCLSEVIRLKNNSFSKIIYSTPNEIFNRDFTTEEIKKINDRMMDNQKYTNKYRNIFSINEKILINDNFRLENKTIKRRNKKRGNWNINGKIVKIYSFNSFKVEIMNIVNY